MSDKIILLKNGEFYHIYNRGINSTYLFKEPENYQYFLNLYDKHISPIAETYAWVLMPNHFHFLLRIKDEVDLPANQTGFQNLSGLAANERQIHQYFSNLFNAYSKAFNKRYNRHGALFERPFKRKLIDNFGYYKTLVTYIHQNPVQHGFCEMAVEYPWSSYLSCISTKNTKIERQKVLDFFNSKEDFISNHNKLIDRKSLNELENWLEI